MAVTAQLLRNIMTEARPVIERQMSDAKLIAGFRDIVASNGGDWSALKALIKAHVEDENDETGDGKRVRKILDKADSSTAYADMLGLANMNENNFSADEDFDPETGEITEQPEAAFKSDDDAIGGVKAQGRLPNAAGVEPSSSDTHSPTPFSSTAQAKADDEPRPLTASSATPSEPDQTSKSTAARNGAGKTGVTAGETAPFSEPGRNLTGAAASRLSSEPFSIGEIPAFLRRDNGYPKRMEA